VVNRSLGTMIYLCPYLEKLLYEAMHNGSCYTFDKIIFGNPGTNRTRVSAKLDAIVQSFHFTD